MKTAIVSQAKVSTDQVSATLLQCFKYLTSAHPIGAIIGLAVPLTGMVSGMRTLSFSNKQTKLMDMVSAMMTFSCKHSPAWFQ